MPNFTTNYNLKKPLTNENYDIGIQNENMDIIDTQVKAIDEKADSKATTDGFNATLNASGWSATVPFTQTVSILGVLATDNPIVDVLLSDILITANLQLEAYSKISRITTSNNSITAYCYDEKPTTDIPIQLKVVR